MNSRHPIHRHQPVRALILATLSLLGSGFGQLHAEHPVSIVQADVYVQKFKTTMRLQCFAEDLDLLQGVEPMENGMYDPDELLDAHDVHAKFLAERIELIDADGQKLKARVTNIGPFDVPDEGIMQGTLMNYALEYELEFKYDAPPKFLTINQRLIAEGMLLPSELKILMKQAGSDEPVLHMMKPDSPKVFSFDWDRPALSSDASEEDRDQWFKDQHKKNLGISSYSSVYSFIYITDTEVRHEVLIPVASLASFIDMERADESYLEIDEQDAAKPLIEALFGSEENEVKIDGVVVQPVFDRIDFHGLDVRDFVTNAPRRKISMYNGRVGVIMKYSTKGPPQQVDVHWEIFNEVVKTVDTRVIAYDQAELTEFSKFLVDDVYRWNDSNRPPLPEITGVDSSKYQLAETPVPVLSIVLGVLAVVLVAGCRGLLGGSVATGLAVTSGVAAILCTNTGVYRLQAPMTANIEATDAIFAQLHKNVFRAFDYSQDEEVYDALAKSVNGPLLSDLFLEVNRSLEMKEKGGAIAKIREVNILEGSQKATHNEHDSPAFGYVCKWNLVGTVEHFGHIHERTTQYEANFDVELIDDAWKITSVQFEDQKHGPIKSDPRTFENIRDSRESRAQIQDQSEASPADDAATAPTTADEAAPAEAEFD